MENDAKNVQNEIALFKYFQRVRLKECLDDASSKLKKEQLKTNGFDKIVKSLTNSEQKAESDYFKSKAELEKFDAKNKCLSKDEASALMVSCFCKDFTGINKIIFAINLALDQEYNYYEQKGLTIPSLLLFDNYSKITDIKNELESYYVKIAKPGLSKKQICISACIFIGTLVASYYLPIIRIGGVNASGKITAHLLKGIGFAADMQKGIGLLTLGTLLTSVAFMGGTLLTMDAYNKSVVKKEFRKMDINTQSINLSIQCVVIKQLKKILPLSEYKEELDKILKSMNELKGDLDFYRYVEKEDIFNNDERIKQFHRFDEIIGSIV